MCLSWFLSTSFVSADHIRIVIPCSILWFLWKAQDESWFKGAHFEAPKVISKVGSFVEQLGRAKVFSPLHFKGDSDGPWASFAIRLSRVTRWFVVSWQKPPYGFVKLNTDASVSNRKALGGGLLRDHEG